MFPNISKTLTLYFFILILYCKNSFCTQFTHDRKRVGPLDIVKAEHVCLKKFTVSENTIIMTKDSRALGAKFLNESDIGNREDCLTFCCATRYCDVAVFQEKKPFACYLFDCGPPDNSLCKFMSHTSYTSAVLAVNRHQLDLGVWSSQTQREVELADLRSIPDNSNAQIPSSGDSDSHVLTTQLETVTATTTTNAPPTTRSASFQPKQRNDRKCSNIQFQCRSGECIAIYNACDGIPQCQDGSDEGTELACPRDGEPSEGAANPPEQAKTQRGSARDDAWNSQQQNSRRKYGPERGIFNHHPTILEYNHYQNDGSPDYTREDGLGYGGNGKGPGYYDYSQRQPQAQKYNLGHPDSDPSSSLYHHEYPEYGLLNRQHEVPSQTLRQQPLVPLQPSRGLETGSLRSPSQQIYQQKQMQQQHQMQQQDVNNGSPWQGSSARYPSFPGDSQAMPQQLPQRFGDTLRDPFQQGYDSGRKGARPQALSNTRMTASQSDNYPQSNQDHLHQPYHNVEENAADSPPKPHSHHRIPDDPNTASVSGPSNNDTSSRVEAVSNPRGSDSNPVAPPRSGGSSREGSPAATSLPPDTGVKGGATGAGGEATPVDSPSDPQSASKAKVVSPLAGAATLSRLTVDLQELEREDEKRKSQTSAAILALSLGLCITALLIVLVGCRIRGVKRRVRRRRGLRSPLEHDADYLVNGMYL